MSLFTILRILSVLIAIVGTMFLLPIGVAVAYNEMQVLPAFCIPITCSCFIALFFLFAGRKKATVLSTHDSFIIVALGWICASLFGALPLYFSGAIPHITDAVFE